MSTSNERVWCTTQLAKLSYNHSIGRTHSWCFSAFYRILIPSNLSYKMVCSALTGVTRAEEARDGRRLLLLWFLPVPEALFVVLRGGARPLPCTVAFHAFLFPWDMVSLVKLPTSQGSEGTIIHCLRESARGFLITCNCMFFSFTRLWETKIKKYGQSFEVGRASYLVYLTFRGTAAAHQAR